MKNQEEAKEGLVKEEEEKESSRKNQMQRLMKVKKRVMTGNGRTPATNAVEEANFFVVRHVHTFVI